MALLMMDGFDFYNMPANSWNNAMDKGTGRFSGECLVTGSGQRTKKQFTTSGSTVVFGLAYHSNGVGSGGSNLFNFYDSTNTVQFSITVAPSAGTFTVKRGSTSSGTVLGTTSVVSSISSWHYYEFKVFIDDTSGTVNVRMDGSTSILSLSGVDTKNTSNANISYVEIDAPGWGFLIDDMIILDTTGASNNDWLGDVRVKTLYPTANGATNNFTPSTGSNYTTVDETKYNTSDYNSSSNLNDIDLYDFQDISTTDVVKAVQVNLVHQKSDAGERSIAPIVRHSATNYVGGTVVESASWLVSSQLYSTNPGTGVAWTASDVNNVQAGIKIVA